MDFAVGIGGSAGAFPGQAAEPYRRAYVFYALVWSTERAVRRRFRRGISAVGLMSGPSGAHFAGITTISITDDDDDDEDEPEEDWDDDWESEDEPP